MKELNGNLLSITSGIILHGCNCSGGFGSGVAGAIAKEYPEVKVQYHNKVTKYSPEFLGTVDAVQVTDALHILNGYTQARYGSDGKRYADLAAVQNVLYATLKYAMEQGLGKIAVPRIGTGLGGLSWEQEVKPIYQTFARRCEDHDVEFEVWFM